MMDARCSGAWSLGKPKGGQVVAQWKLDSEGRGQEVSPGPGGVALAEIGQVGGAAGGPPESLLFYCPSGSQDCSQLGDRHRVHPWGRGLDRETEIKALL